MITKELEAEIRAASPGGARFEFLAVRHIIPTLDALREAEARAERLEALTTGYLKDIRGRISSKQYALADELISECLARIDAELAKGGDHE